MRTIKTGTIQLQQRRDIEGTIIQSPIVRHFSLMPARWRLPTFIHQLLFQETLCSLYRLQILRLIEQSPRFGQRGDHRHVPGSQHLIVTAQTGTFQPIFIQPLVQLRSIRIPFVIGREVQQTRNALPSRISHFGYAKAAAE